MWSGPERTRKTEPRWGEASAFCRAIRLPGGRRRGSLPWLPVATVHRAQRLLPIF